MDKNTAAYLRMEKVILNAFIDIAQEIPFEKLTVQKIADAAFISRYTFYVHFHDKYEVAERIQDDLYQAFIQFIQNEIPAIDAVKADASKHWQMMDTAILKFYQKHINQTKSIINIHTNTIDFSRRLKDFLADNYKSKFPDRENIDLEAMLYANMAMTLSEYYISNMNTSCISTMRSSYIHTFLYAMGIHEKQQMQKEYERFMKMKYPDINLH